MRLVTRGHVRIPPFQRPLRWKSPQVLALFDSLYRGYPIGSLLVFKRAAEAGRFAIGPIAIDAPEVRDAWWVVDGQQRLTALAAGLARDDNPRTATDAFVVFFDPRAGSFKAPAKRDVSSDHWVPVSALLEADKLSEWVFGWPHAQDEGLRAAVFDAGRRLREYRVPLYVLETDDPETLKDIFDRVNRSGVALKWSEVYDALYGHTGSVPSTLSELAAELTSLGMGRLTPEELTPCLLATRGLDPTRTLAEHRARDADGLRGAVATALPALRRTLQFLHQQAEVPHVRLLPRASILEGLARFFALYPEPRPRSLELLARWTWRAFLRVGTYEERTFRRRAVDATRPDDEESSVQRLLALLPREQATLQWPDRFDARSARTRVALLALAAFGPRDLDSGRVLDVAALLEQRGADAFRPIFTGERSGASGLDAANRMLLPGSGGARAALLRCLECDQSEPLWPSATSRETLLASHAISPDAIEPLERGAAGEFVELRRCLLQKALVDLGERLAGWGRHDNDRPSIEYLVRDEELQA